MTALLEDLRFFIGLFFLIVGAILIGQGFINPSVTEGLDLNLATGSCLLLFSAIILSLAIWHRHGERHFPGPLPAVPLRGILRLNLVTMTVDPSVKISLIESRTAVKPNSWDAISHYFCFKGSHRHATV